MSVSDLNTALSKEPRIQDVRIGERLGMAQPLNIRQLIEANRDELERYGTILTDYVKNARPGRPSRVYWLNEPQTLLLCMLSRSSAAADVRQEVIELYMAYRRKSEMPETGNDLYALFRTDNVPKNGRYLVVLNDHAVVSMRPLTGQSIVDGSDPVSVTTFLDEFVSPDILPDAQKAVSKRLYCIAREEGNRTGVSGLTTWPDISKNVDLRGA